MPFIHTITTASVSDAQEIALKAKLGKAIELIKGKEESWLMLAFDADAHMWFKGSREKPCAMVEVKLFGDPDPADLEKMTAAVCEIFEQELRVPQDCVYVKYEACHLWGWNGANF